MNNRKIFWWTLVLTIVFEIITCVLRFGMGLESTRDTASTIGRLTLGLRIHHSYVGVAMLPIALFIRDRWPRIAEATIVIGLALVLSDLIHHFLVLYPITGSPHFHLWYPEANVG